MKYLLNNARLNYRVQNRRLNCASIKVNLSMTVTVFHRIFKKIKTFNTNNVHFHSPINNVYSNNAIFQEICNVFTLLRTSIPYIWSEHSNSLSYTKSAQSAISSTTVFDGCTPPTAPISPQLTNRVLAIFSSFYHDQPYISF